MCVRERRRCRGGIVKRGLTPGATDALCVWEREREKNDLLPPRRFNQSSRRIVVEELNYGLAELVHHRSYLQFRESVCSRVWGKENKSNLITFPPFHSQILPDDENNNNNNNNNKNNGTFFRAGVKWNTSRCKWISFFHFLLLLLLIFALLASIRSESGDIYSSNKHG